MLLSFSRIGCQLPCDKPGPGPCVPLHAAASAGDRHDCHHADVAGELRCDANESAGLVSQFQGAAQAIMAGKDPRGCRTRLVWLD